MPNVRCFDIVITESVNYQTHSTVAVEKKVIRKTDREANHATNLQHSICKIIFVGRSTMIGIFYDTDFGNKDAPRRDQNTGIRCFPTNRPPFSSSYSISNIPGLNPGINENIQNSNVNKKSAASTEYLKLATQGGRKDLLHYEEFQRSATTAHNFHTFKVEEESDKENMRRHQHRLGNFTASNNSSNMNNNNIINNDNNTDNSNKLEIGDGEIPFVDQLVRNTNTTKVTRPDLLPVDNKAKLYFSYNRNDGKFSRIIVSPPRPFKFGGK